MTQQDKRVWLITGSSTGMGRALAKTVIGRGDRLVATARTVAQIEDLVERGGSSVRVAPLDVREPRTIAEAVDAAVAAFGRIDMLIHCAGAGLVGSIEESSRTEVEHVFETNMYGTLNVLDAVLPHMRARRSGHIGIITSQGAFQGQQGCGIYCASKAAVNGICEALAAELAPLGIGVTIIEPGLVRTNFHAAILQAERRLPDYEVTCAALRTGVTEDHPPTAHDVDSAARAIVTAVTAPSPPLNMPLGADALSMIRDKLAFVAAELDTWEAVALTVRPPDPVGQAPGVQITVAVDG
jgi:NAD(P)-dependent dehydrogenase (short-subunit alcohol dehydrogenase family)